MTKDLRIVLTGDALIVRPDHADGRAHRGLRDLLSAADVAATNAEILFNDLTGPPAPDAGIHLSTSREAAAHLQEQGFNLFATANNHALDFGAEGLRAHLAAMDELGMVHAGAGADLTRASRAAVLATGAGRVALVSCATDLGPGWPAADAGPRVAARPGVNQLRVRTTYRLDRARQDALEDIVDCLGIAAKEAYDRAMGPHAQATPSGTTVLGGPVRTAVHPGVETVPEPADLARITAAVRDAADRADLVLVYLHTHVDLGVLEDVPAFARAFAHACIDAGASAVWASGPHVLRGIELYRGRPVLHGLGNFWFQYDQVDSLTPEVLAELGLPADAAPAEFARRTMSGFRTERRYWESAVASLRFLDGTLTRLEFHPVELGFDDAPPDRGTPRLAAPDAARRILGALAERSAALGTTIIVRDGIGVLGS